MQFHTRNEVLMCTYSYLNSRVFLTIIYSAVYANLYCMTKLYLTNDLIHPKLHSSSRSVCSWIAKVKITFIVIHDSTSVISHSGNFNNHY